MAALLTSKGIILNEEILISMYKFWNTWPETKYTQKSFRMSREKYKHNTIIYNNMKSDLNKVRFKDFKDV